MMLCHGTAEDKHPPTKMADSEDSEGEMENQRWICLACGVKVTDE